MILITRVRVRFRSRVRVRVGVRDRGGLGWFLAATNGTSFYFCAYVT